MLPPRDGFAIGREAEIALRQLLFTDLRGHLPGGGSGASRTLQGSPIIQTLERADHSNQARGMGVLCIPRNQLLCRPGIVPRQIHMSWLSYHTKHRTNRDDDTSVYDSDHRSIDLPGATIDASWV
jgi:hypothetical protein